MSYAEHFSTKETPQSERAAPGQVLNSAGGYTFALDKWARLERWLVLGSEGATYYASAREMTRENAQVVVECLREDSKRAVDLVVEMSVSGRAPKNDPAVFALAIAAGAESEACRRLALGRLGDVCRTGTHLFQFVEAVQGFRGWGRGLRRGVGAWYTNKGRDLLVQQVLKYQQRNGWSHRDLLRLAHVAGASDEQQAVFRWVVSHGELGADVAGERVVQGTKTRRERKYPETAAVPEMLAEYEALKSTKDLREVVRLIEKHGYTHEMVPSEAKAFPEVWEALLQRMPMTAMVRNLNKMTAVGLLKPMGASTHLVQTRLTNQEGLKAARVHPIQMLSALKTYAQGHGERGKLRWEPVREIVDGLDEGFYLSFSNVAPTGKNVMLAIDVSGSMDGGEVAGVAGLTPRLGAAAMAMVTARSEKNWHCVAFSNGGFVFGDGRSQWGQSPRAGLSELAISPRQRLDDVCTAMKKIPMGGTDCALPMLYAAARDLHVDAFCVYTDNETWAGNVHPHQALKAYREKTGVAAKLAVVAMTATEFSIADPGDPGMLDFVGFDAAAPSVMADFIRR